MLFVRMLGPHEVEQLRVFMRTTGDVRLLKRAQRAQMVWLSHQGYTVPDIARQLDVDEETVREWDTPRLIGSRRRVHGFDEPFGLRGAS